VNPTQMDWAPAFQRATWESTLEDFQAAAGEIRDVALLTPLIPFANDGPSAIRLKAECLQPLGSFKVRCGANALAGLSAAELAGGVATVSAGNFAQGLAVAARARGARVTAHVPAGASRVKLAALRALGVVIVPQTPEAWMQIAMSRQTGADDGHFIHPVCDAAVIRGNGTIGLELAADWPELDTVVVPIGGGGLAIGIALAFRALGRPVRVVACEAEGAAPLMAARQAGHPVPISRQPSFIDGAGSTSVLDAMWPLLDDLIDDVVVVSVEETKAALRLLAARHHLIAEGAGALGLAAALSPQMEGRNVAVIVSGGNIDPVVFSQILADEIRADLA
jgi:threonine dehydratase